MTNRAMELNDNFLARVNGGTLTPNTFSEKTYHDCGIKTSYHLLSEDEFWLPDGTKTDMAGADAYVNAKAANDKVGIWIEI